MAITEKVLVLGARPFDFKDRETGRSVQGVTVHYIAGDAANGDDGLGWEPQKITVPLAYWEGVTQVPGFYNLKYELQPRPGGDLRRRGTSLVYVTGVDFVAEVDALAEPMTPVVK